MGRGNQYIQLIKVLYCKLLTNGKQLPALPLEHAIIESFSPMIMGLMDALGQLLCGFITCFSPMVLGSVYLSAE